MLTLLTFVALLILRKVSIYGRCYSGVFLCKLPIYTLKQWSLNNNMVNKKVRMSILTSIYFSPKFNVTCINGPLNASIRTHSAIRRKSQICKIAFAILHFSHQNALNYHLECFGIYFSWGNHPIRFKRFILV